MGGGTSGGAAGKKRAAVEDDETRNRVSATAVLPVVPDFTRGRDENLRLGMNFSQSAPNWTDGDCRRARARARENGVSSRANDFLFKVLRRCAATSRYRPLRRALRDGNTVERGKGSARFQRRAPDSTVTQTSQEAVGAF